MVNALAKLMQSDLLHEFWNTQAVDRLQIVRASSIAAGFHARVEVGAPLIIVETAAAEPAALCRALGNAYPPRHPVQIVPAAATSLRSVPLDALETSADWCADPALLLPALERGDSICDLQELVAHLRSPVGCPWDREQTLQSLRHDLLSEAYEVAEAIDLERNGVDNGEHIAEELGDLLLSVILMTQIAIDEGRFMMPAVTRGIYDKLVRRHPHVFGSTAVDDVGEILTNWDAIKRQEKLDKGLPEPGALDGVPPATPALEKARALQSKARKAGLLDRSRLAERFSEALNSYHDAAGEETLGELLWTLVARAAEDGLNGEDALRAVCVRFREQKGRGKGEDNN